MPQKVANCVTFIGAASEMMLSSSVRQQYEFLDIRRGRGGEEKNEPVYETLRIGVNTKIAIQNIMKCSQ